MTTGLGWTAPFAVLAILVLVPGRALASQAETFADLPKLLHAGDVVEIADVSQARIRGAVAELTPASITVVRNGRAVRIGAGDVLEIKLWRRREAGSERLADTGARCGGTPCMAMTLAFAGTTSLARGVGRLFERPRLVYRARW